MTETRHVQQAGSLAKRAEWLIQLRWIGAACVGLSTFACDEILGVEVQVQALYFIAAFLGLYNAGMLILLKRSENTPGHTSDRFVKLLVEFQISADLLILAVLMHFSGGIENPFVFFFIFHMIIASILMSVRESYLQATLAVLSFGLVVLLEYLEIIPHHCLKGFVEHCSFQDKAYVLGTYFVFVLTLYLVVYMASYIAVKLKRAEAAHKQANMLLREKDRIKDEYVMRLTHDIKGHLAAIQSCLAVARTGSLTGQAGNFVERAYNRTIKLTHFSRTLLKLTEMKLNGEKKMRPFPFGDLVNNVVDEVRGQAKAKSVEVQCAIARQVGMVFGDKVSLEELVMNLLLNAIKYTPEGGKISVDVRSKGDSMILKVSDSGIGIAKEDVPRIFDEFFRSENARRMVPESTGLGLSIVKHIVETHGGDIHVESEQGRGTTFSVFLPIHASEPVAVAPDVCVSVD